MSGIDWLVPIITGLLTLASLWMLVLTTKNANEAREWALEAEHSAWLAQPIRARINKLGGVEFDDDSWQRPIAKITDDDEEDDE